MSGAAARSAAGATALAQAQADPLFGEGRAEETPRCTPYSARMRQPVALHHASRLVNHGPTALVTTEHDGRRNVMAAAWSMPVEFTPPRIAVVVDKKTYTSELL